MSLAIRLRTRFLVLLGMVLAGVSVPSGEACAVSLADFSSNIQESIRQGLGPIVKYGFTFAGFCLVGVGLFQLYQRSQQPGQPKGGAFMAIFIGGCLLGVGFLTAALSTSFTGSEGKMSDLGLSSGS